MISQTELLLDHVAEIHADIDNLLEDRAEDITARIQELLFVPDERNMFMTEWEGDFGDVSIVDYIELNPFDRGPQWVADVSAMAAAATRQTWIEVLGAPFLGYVERATDKFEAIRKGIDKHLLKEELKEAAKTGIGPDRFKDAKEKRSTPV